MKIKTLKFSFYLLTVLTIFMSCNNDDDSDDIFEFIDEDRTVQQAKDSDSLTVYLSTHYYNSAFLETATDLKVDDIILTELEEGETVPEGHTLLAEAVEARTTTFLEADYVYYVLNINQGEGDAPNFTDEVRVNFEGIDVETGDVFDSAINTPSDVLLQGDGFTTFGAIRAWQLILPTFNASNSFTTDNGTVNFQNSGLGVMFVPSGLGFFSSTLATGSAFANLIFKFDLLQFQEIDHDFDGIPSFIEDLNNNIDVGDDDTDEDEFPNYVDQDDDGDEVLTFDELIQTTYTVDTNLGEEEPTFEANEYEFSRSTAGSVITITTVKALDTDGNGILDYLDAGVVIDYNSDTSN